MRAFAALVAGLTVLPLVQGNAALAAAIGTALPVEIQADRARLTLVWPAPAHPTLATGAAGTARLRAAIAMTPLPPDRLAALAGWVARAELGPDGRELELGLAPDIVATLSRPHPRMAVIELAHAPPSPLVQSLASLPGIPEPAAGPPRLPPIPVSRPAFVAEPAQALPPAPKTPTVVTPDRLAKVAPRRVTISAEPGADQLELRFRWGSPMPAALFQRGDRLWAAFPAADAEVAGWRSLARAEVAPWLEPLGTAKAGAVRLFRFRLTRPAQVAARPDAGGWRVTLTEAEQKTPDPGDGLKLERVHGGGALAADAAGEVAQVRDPDTGERFGLLMSARGGLRGSESARLVDLELLPTVQGLAWRVLADGVRATVQNGRLIFTRPGGLRLSRTDGSPQPSSTPPPASSAAAGERPSGPRLGLAGPALPDPLGRAARRRQIADELHGLAGLPRADARLELARLYLADALGPEARTALELIETGDIAGPAAGPQRLSRLALSGAAEALAGRADPALARLLDHALDADQEVALWRAYAAALGSRRELAEQEWARSGGLPDSYPDPLRRRLGLELAALLLEDADPLAAKALLERLKDLRLEPEERARLALLEGMAEARAGAPLAAEQTYAIAAASTDLDTATRAAFLLTEQRLARHELTAEQALAELLPQRPRWRGHPWLTRMLARLASLQAETGQPVAAIAAWREAIAANADPAVAAGMDMELRRHLVATLADESVPATTRLALASANRTELDRDPQALPIRARLASAAARLGLADTARELLAGAGAATPATRAELARSLAAAGLPDPERAGSQTVPENSQAALAAAGRRGDWAGVSALAGAALAAAPAGGPLDAGPAEAAVWLGLAQVRLGQVGDSAARYLERLEDPAERTLLELATVPAPSPDVVAEPLAIAAGSFAGAIRDGLTALPRIGEAAPVRTASAR